MSFEVFNIRHILQSVQEEIFIFVNNTLQFTQLRGDYKNLIECFIRKRYNGILFRKPGAFHHARCMGKTIYCLKILLASLVRGQ